MATSERFKFGGTKVQSEIKVEKGKQPLVFVDLIPESVDYEYQTVTVGWSTDRSKFGVWVNGSCVYPIEEQHT